MGISQVAHDLATEGGETATRWTAPRLATTFASILLGAGLLWTTFRNVDVAQVGALLARTGPAIVLPFAAYLITMSVDSLGWRRLLGSIGWPIAWRRLIALRVSIEAVQLSLPWGSVISESLTPALLRSRCSIPLAAGVAATAARKCLFGSTQAVFLLTAALVGAPAIAAVSQATRVPGLRAAFVTVAATLLVITGLAMAALASGSLAEAVRRRVRTLRFERLRGFLDRREASFGHFDAGAAHLFRPFRLLTAAPFVAGVWLAETFETWLLLNLLGVPVSFAQAIPIEAGASILRIVGVAVPAGLGVQEVGYVSFIAATGAPDAAAVGAAFALVKRAKEGLWTAIGYTLLLRGRR
jgi:glycosyltransferase 2 family protein